MNIQRDTLDVLFHRMQPEYLLRYILKDIQTPVPSSGQIHISVWNIQQDSFRRYAQTVFRGFSQDEIEHIHSLIKEKLSASSLYGSRKEKSIFYLLTDFTDKIIQIENGEPVCKEEYILEWRDISFRLGQDILTTAHLAKMDCDFSNRRKFFSWPPVIRSNNPYIREIMLKGTSENHFHLTVSTRLFSLSWISLMNHPKEIYSFTHNVRVWSQFKENLMPNILQNEDDYQMSWEKRIQLAAWIRVTLFQTITKGYRFDTSMFIEYVMEEACQNTKLRYLVELARGADGKKIYRSDGEKGCLDYAFRHELENEKNNGYNRLFVGERWFLYECFCRCFHSEFSEIEQNLFYLYILLKAQFRGEMIQINQRIGFQNFASYQGRKTLFWENYKEYWGEAYCLAINGSIKENNMRALEARIILKSTTSDIMREIYQIDREVLFFDEQRSSLDEESLGKRKDAFKKSAKGKEVFEKSKDAIHFFVLDFPKRKMGKEKFFGRWVEERNAIVRRKAKHQALVLASTLMKHDILCARIRGIDGCSSEIGCRPETFATEFRFLRGFVPTSIKNRVWEKSGTILPLLNATYHVGEDFLDIADGLRAIDEAILFLNLKRKDRLGHVLALGVDPVAHYAAKSGQVIQTKQDRLDDLVWLLFRSVELGIETLPNLRYKMELEARRLLDEIYGDNIREKSWNITLQDYYDAWKLRGDHPSLYQEQDFKSTQYEWTLESMAIGNYSVSAQYLQFQKNSMISVTPNDHNYGLVHYYHFGGAVRKKGRENVIWRVDEAYIALMREIQNGMIHELSEKGIAIECNPSSNVLIGPSLEYDQHPIFRFNQFGLNQNKNEPYQLCVSINTDDQGLFDTSLENEYALLWACLKRKRDSNGYRKYSDDEIYQYLDHIRELGNIQTFPKANC